MAVMKRRGKVIALSTTTLSIIVLIAVPFVVKDKLLERWYLYRLEHGDEEARKRAIEGLEEVGRAQREQWEDTGPAPAPEVAQDLATIYRPAAQRASCRLWR